MLRARSGLDLRAQLVGRQRGIARSGKWAVSKVARVVTAHVRLGPRRLLDRTPWLMRAVWWEGELTVFRIPCLPDGRRGGQEEEGCPFPEAVDSHGSAKVGSAQRLFLP